MLVTLDKRTEETVRLYFEKSQQPFIRAVLPQKARSVEEAGGPGRLPKDPASRRDELWLHHSGERGLRGRRLVLLYR